MSGQNRRLRQALIQECRRLKISEARADKVTGIMDSLLPLCGEQSRSRQMQFRIGCLLMRDEVQIVAPACLDYGHQNGRYTFRDVGGGMSLLAQIQITFLRTIVALVPSTRVTMLIGDQEARDEHLCRALQISPDKLLDLIRQSRTATQSAVTEFGWRVELMSETIPSLVEKEAAEVASIWSNFSEYQLRITTNTISRSDMYYRMGLRTTDEMIQRTIRTAAQYRVMARYVAENGFLVCNHSTVNLSWYREGGAAVLHNPVTVP